MRRRPPTTMDAETGPSETSLKKILFSFFFRVNPAAMFALLAQARQQLWGEVLAQPAC